MILGKLCSYQVGHHDGLPPVEKDLADILVVASVEVLGIVRLLSVFNMPCRNSYKGSYPFGNLYREKPKNRPLHSSPSPSIPR